MNPARDLSFESLIEVFGHKLDSIATTQRGPLNTALKAIREQEPDLDDDDLALLIRLRAEDYRRVYPGMALTPMALAKHWTGVFMEMERRSEERPKAKNEERPNLCLTCGNDKIVVVSSRPSKNPKIPHSPFEECAPCPDCNPRVISWWPEGGLHRRTPDPDDVRRMIGR